MRYADVGLAWVSNIGLDMAVRGKPVVIAAKAKYSGLGICCEPETPGEYFDALRRAAETPFVADPAKIRLGKMYHQIIFKMISLHADSTRYRTVDYRINDARFSPAELRKFYRILVGELNDKGEEVPSKHGQCPCEDNHRVAQLDSSAL